MWPNHSVYAPHARGIDGADSKPQMEKASKWAVQAFEVAPPALGSLIAKAPTCVVLSTSLATISSSLESKLYS